MAKKIETEKKSSGMGMAALAAAGAAAAAAGYYFYASEDAEKNRRIASKWAMDMKRQVIEEAKKLKNIDRVEVAKLVDSAVTALATSKKIDKAAIRRAASELKKNWKRVSMEAGKMEKSTVKAVKKTAKKVVKKVAKK